MKVKLTLVFVVGLFYNCSVSKDNFPEPENLKIEIAKSIKVPFEKSDTLIYDWFLGVCGVSTEEEIARLYEPHLIEEKYLNILKKNYSGTIIVSSDSIHAIIDKYYCGNQNKTNWDCFHKTKVLFTIRGEAVSNTSVTIRELYSYKADGIEIEKLFSYVDNKWTYKVINKEKVQN